MSQKLTPLLAIKKKCLEDCCCGDHQEVKHCPITSCFLYPFRFGHNENRKGIGNKDAKKNLKKPNLT